MWNSRFHAASLYRSCGDHHRAGPRAVPVHPDRREDRRRRGRPGLPRPDPDRAAPRLRVPDARMAAPRHPQDPLATRAETVRATRRYRRMAPRSTAGPSGRRIVAARPARYAYPVSSVGTKYLSDESVRNQILGTALEVT